MILAAPESCPDAAEQTRAEKDRLLGQRDQRIAEQLILSLTQNKYQMWQSTDQNKLRDAMIAARDGSVVQSRCMSH